MKVRYDTKVTVKLKCQKKKCKNTITRMITEKNTYTPYSAHFDEVMYLLSEKYFKDKKGLWEYYLKEVMDEDMEWIIVCQRCLTKHEERMKKRLLH